MFFDFILEAIRLIGADFYSIAVFGLEFYRFHSFQVWKLLNIYLSLLDLGSREAIRDRRRCILRSMAVLLTLDVDFVELVFGHDGRFVLVNWVYIEPP